MASTVSTLTRMSETPPPTTTSCATCNGATSEQSGDWTLLTTTFSITSASWVLSASQPVCTWEGHCLGDPCKVDDGCDRDWECQKGICQPCCSPASEPTHASGQGLGTGAAVGIGVAVPATIAVIAGVAYLLWRVRRKKKRDMYERQRGNTDDFGKSELEGRSVAMDDIAKKVKQDNAELAAEPSNRAELPDHNNEVAVEADTIVPVELEDTSGLGRKKADAIRSPETPSTPRWVEVESSAKAEEALEMYKASTTSGLIASPTATAAAAASPAPTGQTSISDWPLPHQIPGSPESAQSSRYQVSPQMGNDPAHMLRSPVSAITPQKHPFWQTQRSPRRGHGSRLPEGMIDRFDLDDDDEEEAQGSVRRRPGRPDRSPQDPNDDTDDESMFGWPRPPGENGRQAR